MEKVIIDGKWLTIEDVVKVATLTWDIQSKTQLWLYLIYTFQREASLLQSILSQFKRPVFTTDDRGKDYFSQNCGFNESRCKDNTFLNMMESLRNENFKNISK